MPPTDGPPVLRARVSRFRAWRYLPFAVFILVALSVCTATYAINAHYDVSALDQSALIERLATAQTDSDLLVWQDAFDQRAWLRQRLSDPRWSSQILIVGSSTLGGLRREMFPGQTLLNGWLAAPTIEDIEAATELISHTPRQPCAVVLGIDAWFLNPVVDDQRWRSLTDEYIAYHRRHGDSFWASVQRPLRWWTTLKERLTFTTLRETLLFVRRARRNSEPLQPRLVRTPPPQYCRSIRSPEYIRTAIGDYIACPQFDNSQAVVDSEAVTYLARNTHSMAEWRSVDVERAERLREAVMRVRGYGDAVAIVAPPYHPLAYAALRADPVTARNLDKTDRVLASIATLTGAVYVNLRDPARLGCSATDFLDSHHTKATCGRRIAAAVERALANNMGNDCSARRTRVARSTELPERDLAASVPEQL